MVTLEKENSLNRQIHCDWKTLQGTVTSHVVEQDIPNEWHGI